MKKHEFFYSIMSIRLKKEEAKAFRGTMSREHFLPADRFRVIAENDHYRVICKVYERELPQFEYKNLRNYRKTLIHQTLKVKRWLRKARRRSL